MHVRSTFWVSMLAVHAMVRAPGVPAHSHDDLAEPYPDKGRLHQWPKSQRPLMSFNGLMPEAAISVAYQEIQQRLLDTDLLQAVTCTWHTAPGL